MVVNLIQLIADLIASAKRCKNKFPFLESHHGVWLCCAFIFWTSCAYRQYPPPIAEKPCSEQIHFITLDPQGWRERCRFGHIGTGLCEALQGPDAELAALILNVIASKSQTFPPGLGKLYFQSPLWRDRNLSAWSDLAKTILDGTDTSDRETLARLRRAAPVANRNFLNGKVNLGSLAAPVENRMCGTDLIVPGLEGSECDGLSGECNVVHFDEDRGCCTTTPRPAGISCAAGDGLCDGQGGCVPRGESEQPGFDRRVGPFIGTDQWPILPAGAQLTFFADGLRIVGRRSAVEVRAVQTSPPNAAPQYDLGQIQVFESPNNLPFGILGLVAPRGLGERAFTVPRLTEGTTVCALEEPAEQPAAILSDCSGLNVIPINCPSQHGRYRCEIVDENYRVSGPDLFLVWEKTDGAVLDLVPLMFGGLCLFPPCVGGARQCNFGEIDLCRNACGTSFRYCTVFGTWGACRTSPEFCDGVDNDCDGLVDEGPNPDCDDGLPCNADLCLPTLDVESGRIPNCVHQDQCGESGTCAESRCLATEPWTGPGERAVANSPALGCWEIRRDRYCRDTWDGCNCNGVETCEPYMPGADAESGCVRTTLPPCDVDGDLCTVELCCENSERCPAGTAPRECMELTGRWVPRSPLPDEDVSVYCPTTPTARGPLGVTVSTVIDRNVAHQRDGGCLDDNVCDTDWCESSTGECRHRPGFEGVVCGDEFTADMCGRYECRNGVCRQVLNADVESIDCPPVGPIPGPTRLGGTLLREPMHVPGDQVRYISHGGTGLSYPSCHRAICAVDTTTGLPECGIMFDSGLCPEPIGCIYYACTADTTVSAPGNIIGCRQLERSCEEDLPEGNQCLSAACADDGFCEITPNTSLCRQTIPCEEDQFWVVTCNTETGRCEEICSSRPY